MTRHSTSVIAAVAGAAAFELLLVTFGWAPGPPAHATGAIPAHCVEHTPLGDEDDYRSDFHCAGIAIDYHLSGVARSKGPIWAGQWLFTDQAGEYRLGMCTFNRGGHPRSDIASSPVAQTFPNDPDGTRRAYLTWRYGRTTDNLTAAALWALFHFYAQDAAGSNRAANAAHPLVPTLDVIAASSGRQDIEDLAKALHNEAGRFETSFSIHVSLPNVSAGRVTVKAGDAPVPGTRVVLAASGATFADGSTTIQVATDAGGSAAFALGTASGEVTVVAASTAPGATQVYRGVAADPSGVQPQTLLTAGIDVQIAGSATAVAAPTTTTSPETTTTTIPATTTTTPATTTTTPATTTTVAETTTTTEVTTTTVAETTTTALETTTVVQTTPESTTTTDEITVEQTAVTSSTVPFVALDLEIPVVTPPPVESLPKTGSADTAAYYGTALLVAGVGVIGAVRRHRVAGGSADDESDDGSHGISDGFW